MVDPRSLIEQLIRDADMTEMEIAAALTEGGTPVSQATINRIKTGRHARTSFDIGVGLLKLAGARGLDVAPVGR